jgi:hypothetical protein
MAKALRGPENQRPATAKTKVSQMTQIAQAAPTKAQGLPVHSTRLRSGQRGPESPKMGRPIWRKDRSLTAS